MKPSTLTFNLFALASLAVGASAQTPPVFPTGRVSVVVRGEDGAPMPEAKVGVSFVINYERPIIETTEAVTDANGVVSAQGKCDGEVGFGVRKAGYYNYQGEYHLQKQADGQWQPWNLSLDAVLKKVIQPVALYAKDINIELPCDAYPVGYDLVVGDWVEPYGRGQNGDLIFRVDRNFIDKTDYDATLQLSFPNPGDGILPVPAPAAANSRSRGGSVLLLPQLAPTAGYLPQYVWNFSGRSRIKAMFTASAAHQPVPKKSEPAPDNLGYFFRVRTVLDAQGHVLQTMYGKVQREVTLFPGFFRTAHASVGFTYYLNPSGQPNLEFDKAHNLFGPPGRGQDEVTEP